jgi:hypothetical protein
MYIDFVSGEKIWQIRRRAVVVPPYFDVVVVSLDERDTRKQ